MLFLKYDVKYKVFCDEGEHYFEGIKIFQIDYYIQYKIIIIINL